jgi:NAD(H)-dependent 7beta-hydroxy-3-oxo-delta4-cholenoic acid oxidoreductase
MPDLFSSFYIGSLKLKNRVLMAPMSLGYEARDGNPSPKQIAYWKARANGGVGCIITDALSVDPNVPYLGNTLCFRTDDAIEKHQNFVSQIHEAGAKVLVQLVHSGPESVSAFYGVPPVGPSAYRNSMNQQVRELSIEEIETIIEQYAKTCKQIKEAGYDGIELHCAHAYMLLGSFFSPLRNHRSDEYGGSRQNRARLLFEVIDAIKEACGMDFPIVLRISGDEKIEGGNTLEDVAALVPDLVAHGIDAFEISGGSNYEHPYHIIPAHGQPCAINLPQALAIKEQSSVPVLLVGKINGPRLARKLLENGNVDGIVLGRALLADPDFVNKMQENKDDQIALCTSCLVGCVGQQTKRLPGGCVINPFCGHEEELEIRPVKEKKKIAVVGGGLAGMSAARMLKLRGHEPVLFEKEDKLGGQICLACIPEEKFEISRWNTYLQNELKRLKVDVRLKSKADESALTDYEEIVIATGSNPILLKEAANTCTAHDVLQGDVLIPCGNVLIVGGGLVALDTVEVLSERKSGDLSITLIEMADAIGEGLAPSNKLDVKQRLSMLDMQTFTRTKLLSIDKDSVKVHVKDKVQQWEGFDWIIFAIGSKPETSLADQLEEKGRKVHRIGDANKVGQAFEAVHDGVHVALAL